MRTERRRRRRARALGGLLGLALCLVLPVTAVGAAGASTDIVVTSLPPVPGVIVRFDDTQAVTDETGTVTFTTNDRGDIAERITVLTTEIFHDDYRASFTRLYHPDESTYTMGFNVSRPVTFSFTGVNGEVVEASTIDRVQLKNSVGELLSDVDAREPVWLFSQRVVTTFTGLEARDVSWSLESVMVSGVNLVNRAQLRFLPGEQTHIDVPLRFYSARFQVRDLLFKTARSGTLELVHPNGAVSAIELDDDGQVLLASLPRGEYKITVYGAGPLISRPVVLSRNQDIELEFLSWLDLIIIGAVGLIFAAAPVVVGRRLLRQRHMRRSVFGASTGRLRGADLVLCETSDVIDLDWLANESGEIMRLELRYPTSVDQ